MDINNFNDFLNNLFGGNINISIKFVSPKKQAINEKFSLIYYDIFEHNGNKEFIFFCPNEKNLYFKVNKGSFELYDGNVLIFKISDKIFEKNNISLRSKLVNKTLTVFVS